MADLGRAHCALLISTQQRLTGSPLEAATSAEKARELFRSIADRTGGDDSTDFEILAQLADGYRLASVAAAEFLRLQYGDAAMSFLQSRNTLSAVVSRLDEASDLNRVLPGLQADIAGLEAGQHRALLVLAMSNGDFEDAER